MEHSSWGTLWPQIEKFIQSPNESDAWILYATPNSLGSERCKEEFIYALDRALNQRGNAFPIVGLFPSSVDKDLIPAGIRTRLYVSLTDLDWKERIKAAAEGRLADITRPIIEPYALQVHRPIPGKPPYVIEVRPRAGTWSKFAVGIPVEEKDAVSIQLSHGSSNLIPTACMLHTGDPFPSKDGNLWIYWARNQASPTQSYYIHCQSIPSLLVFGEEGETPYVVEPPTFIHA